MDTPLAIAKGTTTRTTSSATGWLLVACIATTLRHLSQPRTRPPAYLGPRSRAAGGRHVERADFFQYYLSDPRGRSE